MNEHLERVYRDAIAAGLGEEGARAAVAVAATEGGYRGALGDDGQSAGTFQLYAKGQLPGFAAAMGMSVPQAIAHLQKNPHAANRWALQGYLGAAIKRGLAQGLKGPALATHAQRTGQVSVSPERAGANYTAVWSGQGRPAGLASVQANAAAQPAAATGGGQVDGPTALYILEQKFGKPTVRPINPEREVETETDELNFLGDPTGKKIKSKRKEPNPEPTYEYRWANGAVLRIAATNDNPNALVFTSPEAEAALKRETAAQGAGEAADPVKAEREAVSLEAAKVGLEKARLDLEAARQKAQGAATPEQQRLAEIEIRKAEIGLRQAELNLEQDLNPRAPVRAPRYPEEEEQAGLNIIKTRQEIEKNRLAALPEQQRIIQDHLATVQQIQGMLERGEIEAAQADAYVAASKMAAEAQLRGATPFQEAKEKREAEQAQKRMGMDFVNQRLASGSSLASTLLQAASKARLEPGQTSLGLDLMGLLGDIQGGSHITPIATGLLTGGGGSQGPTGPVIGTTASGVPVHDPGVSGMRGGLQPAAPAGL